MRHSPGASHEIANCLQYFHFYGFFSSLASSFQVDGEEINLSGTITNITLGDLGGLINVEADNERYGETWLTYKVKLSNPSSQDQGIFHGRATAINIVALRQ